jgi:hypothetical protein
MGGELSTILLSQLRGDLRHHPPPRANKTGALSMGGRFAAGETLFRDVGQDITSAIVESRQISAKRELPAAYLGPARNGAFGENEERPSLQDERSETVPAENEAAPVIA